MTPLAVLEASFDGAIPPHRLRAALREEEAMRKRPRVRSKPPAADTRPIPERIADRIVEIFALRGRCEAGDLHRAGFSPDQLRHHGDAAVAIAARRAAEDGRDLEVPA